MKVILHYGRDLWEDLIAYIIHNRINGIIASMILALAYGSQIFVTNSRVDTADMVSYQGTTFNWLTIGRPGLILTKYVSGLMEFNPYCAGVALIFAMTVACMAFGYLFYKISGDVSGGGILFSSFVFLDTMWAEQVFYMLQEFEIVFALLLTISGAFFCFLAVSYHSRLCYGLSILFMIWSFSSYQLFVVYYAAIVMGCFLLLFERVMRTGEELRFWKLSGTLMVLFAIALIVYLLVSRVYFSSSDYTDSLVDHSSAFTVFRNLAAHIVKALIAYRDVYSIGYTLSLIAMAASALHFRKMSFFRLLLLVVTAFELTPFYMTVVLGSVPTFRVQLVLPFVIAFNFYFAYRILVRMCGRRTYAMPLLGMAVFVSVWLQTMNMQRLFYTDDIREQEDIRLMTQVSLQIGLVTGMLSPDKPVAFVGTHAAVLNPACRIGDSYGAGNMMGGWMNAAEAQFYDRQIRTTITINNSGLDYKLPTKAEYDLALKTAEEMTEFPAEGSIKELDDIIVVKLEKNLKGKARRN